MPEIMLSADGGHTSDRDRRPPAETEWRHTIFPLFNNFIASCKINPYWFYSWLKLLKNGKIRILKNCNFLNLHFLKVPIDQMKFVCRNSVGIYFQKKILGNQKQLFWFFR